MLRCDQAKYFICRQLIKATRILPEYKNTTLEKIVDGADWLEVRQSNIPEAGRGLFTTRQIAKGENICRYTGSIINLAQLMRTRDLTFIYMLGLNKYIDPGFHPDVKGRFVNHHFNPKFQNTLFQRSNDEVYFVAARDIKADEELYTDYGDLYWNTIAKIK